MNRTRPLATRDPTFPRQVYYNQSLLLFLTLIIEHHFLDFLMTRSYYLYICQLARRHEPAFTYRCTADEKAVRAQIICSFSKIIAPTYQTFKRNEEREGEREREREREGVREREKERVRERNRQTGRHTETAKKIKSGTQIER